MMAVGIVLAAVALGDMVAGGLACEPRGLRRAFAGIVFAVTFAVLGSILFGFGDVAPRRLTLLAFGFSASWILLRESDKLTSGRAWACVLSNGFFCALILGWGARVSGPNTGLNDWLKDLPYQRLSQTSAQTVILLIGVVLWLGPTANGIVRAVLIAAGAEIGSSEQRLRGGRIIGILERWMIFGFLLSGAPTAAAIIVSAKSILRFPELNEKAGQGRAKKEQAGSQLNVVTEYLLLGSLVSWILALAPILLFR